MPKGDRLKLKADPEDGTTPIANLLLEAVAMAKLSGLQKGAILYLWRKTYGWVGEDGKRKKECEIGLKEWCDALDSIKSSVATALAELENKHVIIRELKNHWQIYSYRLNTNINQWNSGCVNIVQLSKTVLLSQSVQSVLPEQSNNSEQLAQTERTVIQNRTLQLSKTVPPTLYKENINKDKENGVTEIANANQSVQELKDENKKLKKYPPEHTEIRRRLFAQLKEKRGYQSRNPAPEAVAMSDMLLEGCSESDILKAYDIIKQRPFFADKNLSMMSVKKDIHEVLKNGTNRGYSQKSDPFSVDELKASVGRHLNA